MWPVQKDVSPTQTTTYSVRCFNSVGQSATGSATVNVSTQQSGMPDYVISATATPSNPTVGKEILLEVRWSNIGNVSGPMPSAGWSNPSGATLVRSGSNSCAGKRTLGVGETCVLSNYISFSSPGSKTIGLVVDNTDIALESNENNNTGTLIINVGSVSQTINQLSQIASIYEQLINLVKQLQELKSN